MLSSRMSAQDEEDVQAELAALQAEQVRPALTCQSSHGCSRTSVLAYKKVVIGLSECSQAFLLSQTGTKLPEAPTHALPEVERPAVHIPSEAEARPEERQAEGRQAIAA